MESARHLELKRVAAGWLRSEGVLSPTT